MLSPIHRVVWRAGVKTAAQWCWLCWGLWNFSGRKKGSWWQVPSAQIRESPADHSQPSGREVALLSVWEGRLCQFYRWHSRGRGLSDPPEGLVWVSGWVPSTLVLAAPTPGSLSPWPPALGLAKPSLLYLGIKSDLRALLRVFYWHPTCSLLGLGEPKT